MIVVFGNLKSDDRGPEVTALQQQLSTLGYPLTPTGVYDDTTYVAVRQFQADNGLSVDGVVGPVTQAVIARLLTAQAPTVPLPPDFNPPAVITTPVDLTDVTARPKQAGAVSGMTLLFGGAAAYAAWYFFLRR